MDRSRLPDLRPDPRFTFPEIHRRTLPNGLRVWTVEHHGVPLISVHLLVPAGAAADPPERPGLAAITGDLLDEGSGALSALEVHEALGRIGAQVDTEVGADATLLSLTALERHAGRGLELLADMAVRPRFEPREFERVRDLRLNRLLQLRDLPPTVADRIYLQLLYGGHPYGHLAIGSDESVRAMAIEDVVAFHRRAFAPSRATVIAAGAAPHERLRALVEDAFSGWSDSGDAAPPDPATLPAPSPPADRLALVHRPGAAQSELRVGHVAAARRTPDYHALLVVNQILGGQFVSRINMNLREDKGYTYGARTSFDFRRGAGPFTLQVSVQPEATADALREAFGEIRGIRGERPVSRQELELGRAALTRGYPRNFETAEQIGRAAVQLALYDLPDDYFTAFVPRVLALDEADVVRAAAAHLDPARLLSVVVGDRDRIGPSLEQLDLGTLFEVTAG